MKSGLLGLGMVAVVLSVGLLGCQTTKPVTPQAAQPQPAQPQVAQPGAAPGTLAVTPGSAGFSPNSDMVMDTTMKLALSYGPSESANSWKLEFLDSSQQVQKTFTGDGSNLPMTVSWDGKSDSGSLAPEGTYTARLSVDYGSAFKPGSATSTPFVLDITPPTGSITLSAPLFSPIEGSPTITLTVDASSSLAKIDSWRMEIYDPENHLFRTFESKWPTKSTVWDGKSLNEGTQGVSSWSRRGRLREGKIVRADR